MCRKQRELRRKKIKFQKNRNKRIQKWLWNIYAKKSERKHRYLFFGLGMALIIVLLTTALFLFTANIKKTIEEQSGGILTGMTSRNAGMLEYEISSKKALLEREAKSCLMYFQNDINQALSELEQLKKLYEFYDVGIILDDGTFFSVSGRNGNFSDDEFFKRAMQGNTVISSMINIPESETCVNIYCAPILSDEKPIGAIYAAYETVKFENLFVTPFIQNNYSYVIDASGQIMIGKNSKYENFLENLAQDSALNLEAQEKMRRDMEKKRKDRISFYDDGMNYAYYRPLQINDWYIVSTVAMQDIRERYEPLIHSTMILCFFTGIVIFLGACLVVILQRRQNRELERLAYVDPLTGGKNNIRFLRDAAEVLEKHREKKAAVLAVDIDCFKMINEILGVEAGNAVICGLERELMEKTGPDEVVGHRIADCFLVLWLYSERKMLLRRLESLCGALEALPGKLGKIHFHAAIGVHEICREEKTCIETVDVEQFCGNAMLAAQAVKGGHETKFCFSSEEMKKLQRRNKIYEDEMYPALQRKEFVPWFQPKIDLRTGRICGAEALVRWQKQDGTQILPGQFIPLFEANGFIEKVDQAVIDMVCQYLVRWKENNLETVPISVNLSQAHVYSEGFAGECRQYLEKNHLEIGELWFEITETYAASDRKRLKKAIDSFHAEGFKVLLDDFGTGYSSLLFLQELEFDVMKLDCEFVWKIGEKRTEKILEAAISLAKSLDMKIIAEGVETEAQSRYLSEHGVFTAQGYYYYRPMPAEEFEKLLRIQSMERDEIV